jgi:hypothetical protein
MPSSILSYWFTSDGKSAVGRENTTNWMPVEVRLLAKVHIAGENSQPIGKGGR